MTQPTLSDSALHELIESSDSQNTKDLQPDRDGCMGRQGLDGLEREDEDAMMREDEDCGGGGGQGSMGVVEAGIDNLDNIIQAIGGRVADNEAVCENKSEERVALALPTAKIAEAADQLIENVTADNMYSVYQIMDCEDKYTNAAQKVFLAAATATTVSTAMIATKALLGSYHTFNALTDRVNELEAKLATTEEDLEECEETVEEQEVELEEQERDIELKDEQIFIQEVELEEQEVELAEQEVELSIQEVELEEQEREIKLKDEEIAILDAELEDCEENVEKLETTLEVVLDLVDAAEDVIEDALGSGSESGPGPVPESSDTNNSNSNANDGGKGLGRNTEIFLS